MRLSLAGLCCACLIAAAGCFNPTVEGQESPPDASSATPACAADSDCPQPPSTACSPKIAVCRSGACAIFAVKTLWDADPGACASAADCDCQDLAHDTCLGAFECAAGRCHWKCNVAKVCASDKECAAGQVCEPGATNGGSDCASGKACVAGCHDSSQCPSGQSCEKADCKTCPCPGTCKASPGCKSDLDCPTSQVCEPGADCKTGLRCVPGCRDATDCRIGQICQPQTCKTCPCSGTCAEPPACKTDWECPRASVCDVTPDRPTLHCIPGCRDASKCGSNEECVTGPCPACINCPCVGTCELEQSCNGDAECPSGTICAHDQSCGLKCLPGCRTDAGCRTDETCSPPPPCDSCFCDRGTCTPRPSGCTSDKECGAGLICGQDASCQQSCVPGCRSSSDCRQGEVCGGQPCSSCACANLVCQPGPGCTSDAQCPGGSVCEYPDPIACTGAKRCTPGCHDATQCKAGQTCEKQRCGPCCPGACTSTPPPRCKSDGECGAGTVCDGCLPDRSDFQCVPGCRDSSTCRPGAACAAVVCGTCPCPSQCVVTPGCKQDSDCGPGAICEPADLACAGAKACVKGCRLDAQCPAGEVCLQPDCMGCPCPGLCMSIAPGCTSDAQCGAGYVCEPGPGCLSDYRCVPGCHVAMQCPIGELCEIPKCLTCPCPGSCSFNACLDADGDGYAWSCTNAICPGRSDCDCNDKDPAVHPNAQEQCGNSKDDNCNGAVDEGCTCTSGAKCATPADCSFGQSYCENACCSQCPMPVPPPCMPGQCMHQNGYDDRGCPQSPFCGSCCACPLVTIPVCGTNYQTYNNACEASCAGVEILHDGACLTDEGLGCGIWGAPSCPSGQYCRDGCPMCDWMQLRCTKVGACTADWDCPAGLPPQPCPNAPGTWTCVNHACQFKC